MPDYSVKSNVLYQGVNAVAALSADIGSVEKLLTNPNISLCYEATAAGSISVDIYKSAWKDKGFIYVGTLSVTLTAAGSGADEINPAQCKGVYWKAVVKTATGDANAVFSINALG